MPGKVSGFCDFLFQGSFCRHWHLPSLNTSASYEGPLVTSGSILNLANFPTKTSYFLAGLCILMVEVSKMPAKKTMTLNLTDQEMDVLEELAQKKDISKTAIIRQALRLYQLIDFRISEGEKLYFEDSEKKEKSELMLI